MFKIVFFAIERIAEPLSNQIEKVAAKSPAFQNGCISIANRFQKENARKWSLTGMVGSDWVAPVVESKKAVTMGCEILGEAIVWSVGLGVVAVSMYMDDLAEEVQDKNVTELRKQIEQLSKHVNEMEIVQKQLLAAIQKNHTLQQQPSPSSCVVS